MKKIILMAGFFIWVAFSVWVMEVNAASQGMLPSTDTVRTEGKYYFVKDIYITKYLSDIPESVVKNLRQRVDYNTVCSTRAYTYPDCRELRPTFVTQKEAKHFNIKPDFPVIGFNGFNEVYRGKIAEIKYYKSYTEDGPYYGFEMQLTSGVVADADSYPLYIIASAETAAERVKALPLSATKLDADKGIISFYKQLVIDYYKNNYDSCGTPEWTVPADFKSHDPEAVMNSATMDHLTKSLQIEIMQGFLQLKIFHLPEYQNKKLTLIQFGVGDELHAFCAVENDKIVRYYIDNSNNLTVFVIGNELHIGHAHYGDAGGDYKMLTYGEYGWSDEVLDSSDGI